MAEPCHNCDKQDPFCGKCGNKRIESAFGKLYCTNVTCPKPCICGEKPCVCGGGKE